MKIRLLNDQDIDSWKKLRLEALQDSPESFGSSYEEEVNRSDGDWAEGLKNSDIFGVFIANELVACVGFFRLNFLKTKHRGVIWGMYTKPVYRGRGIASKLLNLVISHAKLHVIQLHLTCVTINLEAMKLYEKQGFKVYGTEPKALKIKDTFFDEHLLVLDLINI